MDAPDAMEAFRLIADGGGADLLVTDMALPGGVSGPALADAARQLDPALQVVFITGYPSDDLPLGAGAALLQKPFNPEQLVGMVRQALAAGQPAAGLLSSAE
jgi:CheY-like chemotaxis protein